jgi:hypothetical protein
MKLVKILKNNLIEIKCLSLKNLFMMGSLHHHNKSISFYSQTNVDKNKIKNHNVSKRRKICGEKPSVEFNLNPMPPSKPNNNTTKQIKSILKIKCQSQSRNTSMNTTTTTTKFLKREALRFTKREITTKTRRKSASIIIVSLLLFFVCLLK